MNAALVNWLIVGLIDLSLYTSVFKWKQVFVGNFNNDHYNQAYNQPDLIQYLLII